MQDVAARAGVSRTTASLVLNDRPGTRIPETTAERVRRAARELDYRPNLAARSLTTSTTRTLALLSDEVSTDGYAGELIEGCLGAAAAAGHVLYVGEHRGEGALQDRLVRDLTDRQVDGFVLATTFHRTVRVPALLRGQPLALLNCSDEQGTAPAVVADDRGGARALAEHLLGLGHGAGVRVVGELPDRLLGAVERRRGLAEAFEAVGLPAPDVVPCNWWPESAYEHVARFLADGHRPTALVCANDRVALGTYQALADAGLAVPDDVAVVSFDDSPMAAWLRPRLTSARIPHRELGRRAVELVLDPPATPTVERLAMPVLVRGSSQATHGTGRPAQ